MCQNNGYKNTNECQFYVNTSAPLSFLDGKNVVFGRVVNGLRAFKLIEKMECHNEKPTEKVVIEEAGVIQPGKK